MDLNVMRALITVLSLLSFIGIAWWAYSSSRRKRFEDAARLVFDEPQQLSENDQ